jgi:Asp/Glu/hydantoin racemase
MERPTFLVVNPNAAQETTAVIDRVARAAASSASVVTIRCPRHRRAPIAGEPFRKINPKPLEGCETWQRHYQGR